MFGEGMFDNWTDIIWEGPAQAAASPRPCQNLESCLVIMKGQSNSLIYLSHHLYHLQFEQEVSCTSLVRDRF